MLKKNIVYIRIIGYFFFRRIHKSVHSTVCKLYRDIVYKQSIIENNVRAADVADAIETCS